MQSNFGLALIFSLPVPKQVHPDTGIPNQSPSVNVSQRPLVDTSEHSSINALEDSFVDAFEDLSVDVSECITTTQASVHPSTGILNSFVNDIFERIATEASAHPDTGTPNEAAAILNLFVNVSQRPRISASEHPLVNVFKVSSIDISKDITTQASVHPCTGISNSFVNDIFERIATEDSVCPSTGISYETMAISNPPANAPQHPSVDVSQHPLINASERSSVNVFKGSSVNIPEHIATEASSAVCFGAHSYNLPPIVERISFLAQYI
jgi:hypothetical protein